MKRLVSIAAAAAFSALSIAGTAQAATMWNNDTAAIQSLKGNDFTLTRIDSLGHAKAAEIQHQADQMASSVQKAIRSNPTLLRDLKAQNVEVGNVVAANKAADGTVTFYLR